MKKNLKIRTILTTSRNSFGDLTAAYVATDGKTYVETFSEGSHSDCKAGKPAAGKEVRPKNGVIDVSFIHAD